MSTNSLRLIVLDGEVLYEEAHTLQRGMVSSRIADEIPDTLILLEHAPVITIGNSGTEKDIRAKPRELAKLGISVHKVERGGRVTYHGPGQIVGYPIFDLLAHKMGVEAFVRSLEETMIRAAKTMGVEAISKKGSPGIYCEKGKIGAIGVRVTRGVTFHGFSFNLNPNLDHYKLIDPCGGNSSEITSVQAAVGKVPPLPDARRIFVDAFCDVFKMTLLESK